MLKLLVAICLFLTSSSAFSREMLSSNRTYYVRSDGSNSNDGLSNSSSGAFLTLQKAVDTIWDKIDGGGYACNIQLGGGSGTFAGFTRFGAAVGCIPQLLGDTTTPSNYVLTSTSPAGGTIDLRRGAQLFAEGFRIKTVTSGRCVHVSNNSLFNVTGKIDLNDCIGGGISAEHQAVIGVAADVLVTGNMAFVFRAISESHAALSGNVIISPGLTFSSATVVSQMNSMVQHYMNYSGSVPVAVKYLADGGEISSSTAIAGSINGQIMNGGIYNGISGTGGMNVNSLPACNLNIPGARSFVLDATSATFGMAVSGGGSNRVPVVCDGYAWRIG